jgi:alkane 1-monooxygenase
VSTFKPYGYLLAYAVPTLLPLAWWLGVITGWPNAMAWLPLLVLFVVVPALDHCIGLDTRNPDPQQEQQLDRQWVYRVLTLLCLPLYLVLLGWSLHVFVHGGLSLVGQLGWLLAQGVVGGVLAINVAHELIHKSTRLESVSGGLLLACVGYGGFKVEHVRGHHVHVSTPADASSAERGITVYRFVARAIPSNTRNAFALEAARLAQRGLSAWHWRNEVLQLGMLSLVLLLACVWLAGPAGGLFFAGQGIIAIISLEIINYIEHYGLERRRLADGRYERTTHLHSWNSGFLLTNLLLFQLQRHSDHHAFAKRRYQILRHHPDSPQLPSGYAGMFVLALLPPLWFRVMDKRLPVPKSGT